MKRAIFSLCMTTVFVVPFLVGCQAADVGDKAQLAAETPLPTQEAVPQPTQTPVPTAEPTPAVDLNKTYTLEQLKESNQLKNVLQQYGTASIDYTSNGNPEWEITQSRTEYKLDENGYLQINDLIGADPFSNSVSSLAVQDCPGYAYKVSFDDQNGEKHLTFYDTESYYRGLDFPWYGMDPVFEYPTETVITDTHVENNMIVMTVAYRRTDGTGNEDTDIYYVDPATDIVMKIVSESSGDLGGEIQEPRRSEMVFTPGATFENWSTTVQSVTQVEGGLHVTFSIYIADEGRPVERQMVLSPNTYLGAYEAGEFTEISSDASMGDEQGMRRHPTTDGQKFFMFGP